MLLMNKDEAITQRRNEISRSQRRHTSLLRAIFSTTIRTLTLQDIQQPQTHDLAAFLEVNNITNGRSFDPSTLPSTASFRISKSSYATRSESYHSQQIPNRVSEKAIELQDDLPRAATTAGNDYEVDLVGRDSLFTKASSEDTPRPPPDGTTITLRSASVDGALSEKSRPKRTGDLDTSVGEGDSAVGQGVTTGPSVPLFQASPSFTDDVRPAPPAIVEKVGIKQRQGITDSVQVLSPEADEEQSDDRVPDTILETDHGEEHGTSALQPSRPNAIGFTSPTSDKDRGHSWEEDLPVDQNGSVPGAIIEPQQDISGPAVSGPINVSTDEQPALVEAPSTQSPEPLLNNEREEITVGDTSSLMPPPATDFVHDSLMSQSVVEHISDENNEVSAGKGIHVQNDLNRNMLRPTSGMRDHVFPGINGDSSRDLTLSRRPPMRIDTGMLSGKEARPADTTTSGSKTVSTPSESETPNKQTATSASAQSPPERMTTRVSSGALRHKSVSEILGETPRATPTQVDKSPFTRECGDTPRDEPRFLQTPKSASSFTSPDIVAFKRRLSELKEKERSKLSTVVFSSSRNPDITQAQDPEEQEVPKIDRDYMLTLFNFQVASPPRAHTLNALVKSAHKTLTTSDHLVDFTERQACRMLNKIYELQAKNRWSFRQIERSAEPARPVTHWDVLLGEMKWMRTDFREERKWKSAAARHLAYACAEWIAASSKDRKSLQVKVRANLVVEDSQSMLSTPDLVHSPDDDTNESTADELTLDPGNAPAAIFSLPPEMFVFGLNKSPVSENLLQELPLYQPNVDIRNAALQATKTDPDAPWKKPLVPVSKYVQGKLLSTSISERSRSVPKEEGPPRKRRRFDYCQSDKNNIVSGAIHAGNSHKLLDPEQNDVALFDPEQKHIRDRIHSSHQFRPPSEYQMPSESFFVARQSSQWTQAEDDELRRNVKDFSYNWSLISSAMTFPSSFTSGAERRTPWECFERWIGLEGLPVEMAKINYFRAYHSRLQSAAQKTAEAQQAAQQSQGNTMQLSRRRTTQPYTVERRKDQRHLHLVDAMRKLAKKRETALNKQQHVAGLAAMRKANETNAPKQRPQIHTPQEFSRLKHEKQMQFEEKARVLRAIHNQKAIQAMKVNHQAGGQPNGVQPVRNSLPGVPNGSSPNMNAASHSRGGAGDLPRPVQQMQRVVNGQANGVLPTHAHGVPHAPMQSNPQMQVQMQQRVASGMGPERVMQEVSRVQAQQQVYQQHIRHSGQPQTNGRINSPSMQNPNLLPQGNPGVLNPLQGRSSPQINGVPPATGTSTSPRMTQPQTLSSGMTPAVNQISSQFQARHPQASPEQIKRMTTDQLYKISNEARHHAMQAAAGHANANAVNSNSSINLAAPNSIQQAALMANGGNPILNPAHYAQIMRSQQASQQRGVNGNSGPPVNGSRSATPSMHRPGSSQGGPPGSRPSHSPSARQAVLATQAQ